MQSYLEYELSIRELSADLRLLTALKMSSRRNDYLETRKKLRNINPNGLIVNAMAEDAAREYLNELKKLSGLIADNMSELLNIQERLELGYERLQDDGEDINIL